MTGEKRKEKKEFWTNRVEAFSILSSSLNKRLKWVLKKKMAVQSVRLRLHGENVSSFIFLGKHILLTIV